MTAEEVRRRVRAELTEATNVETADYLLDRPSGGWDTLATKEDLTNLETKIDARIETLEHRIDTKTGALDTKIAALETKIDTSIAALDTKIDTSIGALDTKIDTSIAALDTKVDTSIAAVQKQIADMGNVLRIEVQKGFQAQTWRLVTAMIGIVGVVVAAIGVAAAFLA